MTKKISAIVLLLALVTCGLFIWLSEPQKIEASALPAHVGDKANGAILYHAGGCISCHKPAADIADADPKLPSGGAALATPIGTLYPPNITPDQATGIGGWSDLQFVNAMKRGISPSGDNYIPAFPYLSYARMSTDDILDIKAYLMSLKPVSSPRHDPNLSLPWLVRRGVGIWKRLAFSASADIDPPAIADPNQSAFRNRGAYLVKGPGHCAECHTPRNFLMIPDQSKYLAGGLHPNGRTKVPSLHNLIGRGLFKNVDDLADALKQGEEGGYENMSAGGMGEVQSNLAQLPDADVKAIATYLGSLK